MKVKDLEPGALVVDQYGNELIVRCASPLCPDGAAFGDDDPDLWIVEFDDGSYIERNGGEYV